MNTSVQFAALTGGRKMKAMKKKMPMKKGEEYREGMMHKKMPKKKGGRK